MTVEQRGAERGLAMDRIHLTSDGAFVQPYDGTDRGTVIADVRCASCGMSTAVLGHFTFETILQCCACGKVTAVIDPAPQPIEFDS